MPRSRSAPKPASAAAAPRPRPAASPASSPPPSSSQQSTSWFGGSRPQQQQSTPPPAQHHAAPSPSMQQPSGGGGGMLSGLFGGVMQGAALGTGSAFAHRAVDGVMGGREVKVVHEHEGNPQPPAAASPASTPMMQQQPGEAPCGDRIRLFSDCMSQYNGDMGACQPYFDAMQQCKKGAYA